MTNPLDVRYHPDSIQVKEDGHVTTRATLKRSSKVEPCVVN